LKTAGGPISRKYEAGRLRGLWIEESTPMVWFEWHIVFVDMATGREIHRVKAGKVGWRVVNPNNPPPEMSSPRLLFATEVTDEFSGDEYRELRKAAIKLRDRAAPEPSARSGAR
jgi:hypothetical protein